MIGQIQLKVLKIKRWFLDPRHVALPRDAPALTALPFLSPLAAEPPAWHGEAEPRHEQRKTKNAD